MMGAAAPFMCNPQNRLCRFEEENLRRNVYVPKENFPSLQIFWPCGIAAQENLCQQNEVLPHFAESIDEVNAQKTARQA